MNFNFIPFKKSQAFKNSIWGAASSILQNIFLSVFFVILARKYSTFEFAQFLIANTLYQIVSAFSSMGLGQWFIREYISSNKKEELISKFIKLQFLFGVIFYLISILLGFTLYNNSLVKKLTIVLGINVILDNIIYAIRNLNVAQLQQRKTFLILLIDAVLRLLIGISILIYPLSILSISVLIIVTRFATLNLFIRIGVSKIITARSILFSRINWSDLKETISSNWSFLIIGSVSIIYWRVASVVISKMLTNKDVANYEVSFRIFILAQVLPLILSSSIFPSLIKIFKHGTQREFQMFYRKVYLLYFLFGLASFAFIYSFSNPIITYAFGLHYQNTSEYTRQMFLTMLIFPTALLQANVLIAINLERSDMWINIISLISYLVIGFIGLHFIQALSVINYSIFASWIIFHMLQDKILISKGITSLKHVISFYLIVIIFTLGYIYLAEKISPIFAFCIFITILLGIIIINIKKIKEIYFIKETIIPDNKISG